MQCPRCGATLPTWPKACEACGLELAPSPSLEPPPDLAQPAPLAPPTHAALPPPAAPPADYRTHLIVGGILAFVSTLLPFLGVLASGLGLWVFAKAQGPQRQQGVVVAVAGLVGLAFGVWVYVAACDLPNLRDACAVTP
ncbi:MAG: hypothetical protein LC624_05575 [Halobacteriales archaeon]|nr:hypothetical protein [Halobacteriales archaeon]